MTSVRRFDCPLGQGVLPPTGSTRRGGDEFALVTSRFRVLQQILANAQGCALETSDSPAMPESVGAPRIASFRLDFKKVGTIGGRRRTTRHIARGP
jgi:hypothetical protein